MRQQTALANPSRHLSFTRRTRGADRQASFEAVLSQVTRQLTANLDNRSPALGMAYNSQNSS